jgi:hypothetical protein
MSFPRLLFRIAKMLWPMSEAQRALCAHHVERIYTHRGIL